MLSNKDGINIWIGFNVKPTSSLTGVRNGSAEEEEGELGGCMGAPWLTLLRSDTKVRITK